MRIKDHIFQPTIERSIVLMAVLAIIESLQVLIIVALVFSFIPIIPTMLAKDFFPNYQATLKPGRQLFFYHVWVLTGIIFQAAGLFILRKRLADAKTDRLLVRLIAVDGVWLLLQLFFVFKMIMYAHSTWARPLFYVILGLAMLSRFFWIEVNAFLSEANENLSRWSSKEGLRITADVSIALFLVLSLWIVDQQRLWAVIDLAGNKALAVQSWHALSPLIRNIDYQKALPELVILSLLYYGCLYLFLRRSFGSVLLAGSGVLLAVKWQYFHNGIAPDIWQFPSKTVLPLFPDVFFWICVLVHIRQKQQWSLVLAGLFSGFYLAYHLLTGIWLWLGWGTYLALTKQRSLWFFLPWVVCFAFWLVFLGIQGTLGLVDQYWLSLVNVLQGQGSLPFYDCLKGRNFFAFTMQFIIPVFYFVTIVLVRTREMRSLIVPIAVYGLGLFTAHVWQPSLSNYDSVSSPLVILLCFWLSQALGHLPFARRIILLSLLVIVYAGALLTNNVFGIYPNAWNMAGVDWPQILTLDQQHTMGR